MGEQCFTLPGGDVIPASIVMRIARAAHEQNRAYCEAIGDQSQAKWEYAPQWQRDSAINGVLGVARGHITSPGDAHRSWLAEKQANGWTYGPVKDADAKTHPCMVPYEELPQAQQEKDALFLQLAKSLLIVLHPGPF
jgi:hypothetical protein